MKPLILLFTFLFISSALNAQDTSCQRLINLQNMQKINFSRMTTKHSPTGGMHVVERDKLSNSFMCNTISALGKQMKSEHIFFNKKSYSRKNDEQWRLEKRVIDTSMLNSYEQTKQNTPLHNCQQLNDEVLNGERCFVFIYERNSLIKRPAKEKSNLSNSGKYIKKEWYNEQGQLKKTEMKTNTIRGEYISVTTFEYDIDIPLIKEPVIKKN
jgi:hypothetical protein